MPTVAYPPTLNIQKQAAVLPAAKQGESAIFANALWPRSVLTDADKPGSLFELFEQSVARHPDQPLFQRRLPIPGQPGQFETTLTSTTYATVQSRRTNFGSALLSLERAGSLGQVKEITNPGQPTFGEDNRRKAGARRGWAVGIWSENREEWQVADLACQAYGLVGVSIYETLGPEVVEYISNNTPLPIIVASGPHLATLLRLAPTIPTVKAVVSMDILPPSEWSLLTQWAKSVGITLKTMAELEAWGAEPSQAIVPGPGPDERDMDIARVMTISYTSGTTGNPKGAVLTNFNITTAVISNAHGQDNMLDPAFRFISFLPLSHIYERFLQLLVIYIDGIVCFTTGDNARLLEDAQIIQPHMMAGVPRVWNRIHAAIKTQMNAGGLKGALLTRAVNAKLDHWRKTGEVTHKVYDALVFRKVRALLGGQVVYMTSGSAPLAGDVLEMLKICFSCDVVQGFGMTETIGTCTKQVARDVAATGTCGMIQPCNDLKLVDVQEMGYTSKDLPNPRGELCVRGHNVFVGYLNDPENTKKTIDEDGWMHTGDIAEIDGAGRLKIVDRLKNVLKLSQGEYVALEKLEGIYALDPLFSTLMVHGDSLRSHLIALAVVDPIVAAPLVSKVTGRNVSAGDVGKLQESVKDPRVRKAVVAALAKAAKERGLNGFEMIKGVHLMLTPFPDNLLTPTLKVKRAVAAKHFKNEIDTVYEESEQQENARAKL